MIQILETLAPGTLMHGYVHKQYQVHSWILEKMDEAKITIIMLGYSLKTNWYPFGGALFAEIVATKAEDDKCRLMFEFKRPLAWEGNRLKNGELQWTINYDEWNVSLGYFATKKRFVDIQEAYDRMIETVSKTW